MVRAFAKCVLFTSLNLAIFIAGSSAFAKDDCVKGFRNIAAVRAELDAQIAANIANPPVGPYRTLQKNEYTVVDMNGGKPFDHQYIDGENVLMYWRPKKTIGKELRFKDSRGRDHVIQVYGSSLYPGFVEGAVENLLSYPAAMLESVKRVEVQGFVRNSMTSGYAIRDSYVLHEGGVNAQTQRHEFGHTLAHYLWGNSKPYDEYRRAFEKDGKVFVSNYAQRMHSQSQLAEDFAEAVEAYIRDPKRFRERAPNRAALLDTVAYPGSSNADSSLADGGVWNAIQTHYNGIGYRTLRFVQQNNGIILVTATGTGAAGLVGVSMMKLSCETKDCSFIDAVKATRKSSEPTLLFPKGNGVVEPKSSSKSK